MGLIALENGKQVLWEPTTDLICMYCRNAIDIHTLRQNTTECANFMFDFNENGGLALADGVYWYFHKRCSGIEDALLRQGARIMWGWFDMKSVLGIDNAVWKRMTGDTQKYLKKSLPTGIYDHLYEQWLPAIKPLARKRIPSTSAPNPVRQIVLRPPQQIPSPRQPKAGYTYLIEAVGTNRIKIGHGQNVTVRMQQLSTGTPFPLRLLRKIPAQDSYGLEQALHARYAPYKRHNEWFELPPDMLAALLQEVFP